MKTHGPRVKRSTQKLLSVFPNVDHCSQCGARALHTHPSLIASTGSTRRPPHAPSSQPTTTTTTTTPNTAPLAVAVAASWLVLNLLAFHEPSRRWPVLSLVYEPLIFALRSSRYVRSVVGALWLAHLLEAGYAAALCGEAGLPAAQIAGWSTVVFLMGFGVLPGLRRDVLRAKERHQMGIRRALAERGAQGRRRLANGNGNGAAG